MCLYSPNLKIFRQKQFGKSDLKDKLKTITYTVELRKWMVQASVHKSPKGVKERQNKRKTILSHTDERSFLICVVSLKSIGRCVVEKHIIVSMIVPSSFHSFAFSYICYRISERL